ncbi:sigma-54-dependent Fis family transcriptional regulator [Thermodesulfomicrobium sp. WS]|uniref:sigma-54 interaction domain-containing protein n=1 Tax=Thermodesulfomicrobium sp. WS TaxID=3004129 RepID=UPI0024926E7A|nr:sigma-54 dependent transcriptional regulator [Thermodesulfomicrobium sp. WS]BDV01416.1 sigma-54-dependent Fis family transcriptional regulator [Thermodesulfomicrobium sp. WS]
MGRKKQTAVSGNGQRRPSEEASAIEIFDVGFADELGQFVFQSKAMRDLYELATQVAGSDATVMISGESGTGKELFARLVHQLSGRRSQPFVPVNCGVVKGELFADKFFGHEPGAFTGASRQRKGLFEIVGHGTLFLDEVGDIPVPNQVDFLRVLEERSFRRLGGEKTIGFHARIVAATNRCLQTMIRTGEFRADLYYRLHVVAVTLPPLRDRVEDIPPLVEYFLEIYRRRYHKPSVKMSDAAMDALMRYSWPGNVRELRNLMERLVLLSREARIDVSHLPLELRLGSVRPMVSAVPAGDLRLETAVREAEIAAILRAWEAAGGSKARLAEILDVSPRTLRYKLAHYGLRLS